jgi:hypothetical protein
VVLTSHHSLQVHNQFSPQGQLDEIPQGQDGSERFGGRKNNFIIISNGTEEVPLTMMRTSRSRSRSRKIGHGPS